MSSAAIPDLSSLDSDDLLELVDQATQLLAERFSEPAAMAACTPLRAPSRGADWGAMLESDEGSADEEDSSGSETAMTLPALSVRVERVARSVLCLQTALAGHTGRVFDHGQDRSELLGIPEGKCAFRNASDYLRQHLRITRREAQERLGRAHQLMSRSSGVGGESAPPRRPELAEALQQGAVDAAAADLVAATLSDVQQDAVLAGTDQGLLAELVEKGEQLLTTQARTLDPDQLRRTCDRWKQRAQAVLNPDGQEPNEAQLNARQGLFYGGRRDGLYRWSIRADELQHEVLLTVVNAVTNPRSSPAQNGVTGLLSAVMTAQRAPEKTSTDAHEGAAPADETPCADGPAGAEPTNVDGPSTTSASAGTADEGAASTTSEKATRASDRRSRPRKQLDGIVSCLQGALAMATGNGLPASGGIRPQVIVTIDYERLQAQLDSHRPDLPADAAYGGPVSPTTIRTIACDAQIIPAVLGGDGEVLDVGRSQRIFSPRLRRAIIARDGGCAAPGCTFPAPWCECHHVNPWEDGGGTSVDNGVLLCSHHHHAVHAGAWRIDMRAGTPWFIPAPYLDPGRTPQRNLYWKP